MSYLPTTVALTVDLKLDPDTLLLIVLAGVLVFGLGGLLGAALQDRVHETERRRRTAARRRQAEELRRLHDYAEACEEDMRWHSKSQAGRGFDDGTDAEDACLRACGADSTGRCPRRRPNPIKRGELTHAQPSTSPAGQPVHPGQ